MVFEGSRSRKKGGRSDLPPSPFFWTFLGWGSRLCESVIEERQHQSGDRFNSLDGAENQAPQRVCGMKSG